MSRSPRSKSGQPDPILITPEVLHEWPLPQPGEDSDKEERGRVLVVGGAQAMPGAIILAATAALRAGAGKLQIATVQSIAHAVGVAVPESLVYALPENKAGSIAARAVRQLAGPAGQANALVIGPGMLEDQDAADFVRDLLAELGPDGPLVVLDAAAFAALKADPDCLRRFEGRAIITPHPGEMAMLLDMKKEAVTQDRPGLAAQAAERFGAVVAFKGADTYIAAPGCPTYCNTQGTVGLATSGSGDTLSGIVGGLAARGSEPQQATVWGVYLHAAAGHALEKRLGRLGFLAREVLHEIPPIMHELSSK